MGTGASDAQLEELLNDTKALLCAAQRSNTDEIGRQLEKRRKCLDAVASAGGAAGAQTDKRKTLIREILLTDKKANERIKEYVKEFGKTASNYKKKAAGVLKYSYSKFNLSSGQLIDKRD